jgi:hypothetical protein
LETLFIERMDQNEEIFARYMNDPAFQNIVATGCPARSIAVLVAPRASRQLTNFQEAFREFLVPEEEFFPCPPVPNPHIPFPASSLVQVWYAFGTGLVRVANQNPQCLQALVRVVRVQHPRSRSGAPG